MLDKIFDESLEVFEGTAINPAFINILMDFLNELLANCNQGPEEIESTVRRGGRWVKRQAKRKLRHKIGRAKFRALGDKWADSMLLVAQRSPEGAIADIVEDMI